MSDYYELLKHPLWQRKRLEIMKRADFTCQMCLEKEGTLHVHHISYHYGNKPWEYPDENFKCLCENCHCEWHRLVPEIKRKVDELHIYNMDRALGYIDGIRASCLDCDERVNVYSDDYAVGVADAFGIYKRIELMEYTVGELCAIAITGE